MDKLQSLIESSNEAKVYQHTAKKLAAKWEKTGLLKDLKEGVEKTSVAVMLEQQAKQVLKENITSGGTATFLAGTGENWSGIALPLVRKIFGKIMAKEFLSTQPMTMPSGLAFYLDLQYANTKLPFTTGDSVFGSRSATGTWPFQTLGATGGLYGAGKFSYSSNQFSASAVTATITSASYADVNMDSAFSSSIVGGTIKKLAIANASASVLANMDFEGVRAFMIVSGAVGKDTVLPEFTSYNKSTDILNFYVTASTAQVPTANAFVVYYNKLTKDNNRGDFEDGSSYSVPNSLSATQITIPKFNIKLQSEALIAKTRKLAATWTPEFQQDLQAYQNIDAEAELTNLISDYVGLEIDLELLDMLIQDAYTVDYWSARNNTVINSTATGFEALTSGYYNSQGQWFQTLGTKVQKMSNTIHQLTLRGGISFMVMSPKVATILESIPGFASTSTGAVEKVTYAFGSQKAGQLNGEYTVYKNPYMTSNLILVGYKGNSFLETGAVYSPYVPLIMTPLVYDPETYTPSKGLLTRYAKKMLRPEFYGKIYVEGIETI